MDLIINIRDFLYYNRKKIFIIIIFIFLLIGVIYFYNNRSSYSLEEMDAEQFDINQETVVIDNLEEKFVVDIKGEVKSPGTYSVNKEMRIIDVINLAGGLLESANSMNINLSKKVEDEMVIIIPSVNSAISEDNSVYNNVVEVNDTSNKVSINTASVNELMTIKGLGFVKSTAIVEYRKNTGKFQTIDDIKNVPGIGDSTFEKIKDFIKI